MNFKGVEAMKEPSPLILFMNFKGVEAVKEPSPLKGTEFRHLARV